MNQATFKLEKKIRIKNKIRLTKCFVSQLFLGFLLMKISNSTQNIIFNLLKISSNELDQLNRKTKTHLNGIKI